MAPVSANGKSAAVLTISDSSYLGQRQDLSGPEVVKELEASGFQVLEKIVIPDERERIVAELIKCCNRAQLVITVGGTGIAARDVTPEATMDVLERTIEGIPERMRAYGVSRTPMATLSRGVCGVRNRSLILNLPGNPKAAVESLQAVIVVLPHALDLLAGNTGHPE